MIEEIVGDDERKIGKKRIEEIGKIKKGKGMIEVKKGIDIFKIGLINVKIIEKNLGERCIGNRRKM